MRLLSRIDHLLRLEPIIEAGRYRLILEDGIDEQVVSGELADHMIGILLVHAFQNASRDGEQVKLLFAVSRATDLRTGERGPGLQRA